MGFLDKEEPLPRADWSRDLGYRPEQFTYGIELEAVDFEWGRKQLCPANAYISSELAVVNSDGQAFRVGETQKGGELNTHPTKTIDEQIEVVREFNRMYPEAKPNHRLKFQVHVGVPGLADDIQGLKRLLDYTYHNVDTYYDRHFNFTYTSALKAAGRQGAVWWRYVTYDRSKTPVWRYRQLMDAQDAPTFWRNYMLNKKGQFTPPQARRYGVNMLMVKRQGTIEFRHFFPTTDPDEARTCLEYSREFTYAALRTGEPLDSILDRHAAVWSFPKEIVIDPELERSFRATRSKEDARMKQKYVLLGKKAGDGASKEGKWTPSS